jgi:hypothetical protein
VPIVLTHAIRAVELGFRLLYFAVAPALLVLLATQYPIAGVVTSVTFAVAVFAFASGVRPWTVRYPVLGRLLGAQLRFEAFYKEHPPKPFVYYALYPLLFPYWLSQPVARRELGLYRGLTAVGLLILLGGAAWDYFRKWYPEIPFRPFAESWVVVFVIQALVAITFVMPLATTVVTLKLQGRSGALGAMFAVAAVSITMAVAVIAHRRHAIVQVPTGERMVVRTQNARKESRKLREEAVQRAFAAIVRGDASRVKEPRAVEILGGPIVEARETLGRLYREDELPCFHLVAFRGRNGGHILVLFGARSGRSPLTARNLVWLGLRDGRTFVDDPKELPDGALGELRRIANQ